MIENNNDFPKRHNSYPIPHLAKSEIFRRKICDVSFHQAFITPVPVANPAALSNM